MTTEELIACYCGDAREAYESTLFYLNCQPPWAFRRRREARRMLRDLRVRREAAGRAEQNENDPHNGGP